MKPIFQSNVSRVLAAVTGMFLWVVGVSPVQAQMVTVNPVEAPGALTNPLMGFRPKIDQYNNYPYPTLIQMYIPWNEIENHESDSVQKIRDYCNARWANLPAHNVKVIPRVWIDWDWNTGNEAWPADLTPGDWSSQQFKDRVVRLVGRLGEVWNNDPRVAWVQTGIIGYWGEQENPLGINQEWSQRLGDAFTAAFPNKMFNVRNMGSWPGYNAGVYWDSFGHPGQRPWAWQEIINFNQQGRYLTQVVEGEVAYNSSVRGEFASLYGGVQTTQLDSQGNFIWQSSPDMTLSNAQYTDNMIDVIRELHCSALGWISSYNPNDPIISAQAARMQREFGYRFHINEFSCSPRVDPGNYLDLQFKIQNKGSAPIYEYWPLAVVLVDKNTRQVVWKSTIPVDIRKWRPGSNYSKTTRTYQTPAQEHLVSASIQLPANVPVGEHLIGLSILEPLSRAPGVFFAVPNFLKESQTQPLCKIGIGMNATGHTLDGIAFDNLVSDDTRTYSLTPQGPNFTLTTEPSTLGTIPQASPNGSYPKDTGVEVRAVGILGYGFSSWGGVLAGTTKNPAIVVMDANKSVSATYAPCATYTLNTSSSHGSITLDPPGGVYNVGTEVTVTMTPSSGYALSSWGGDLNGSSNPATITIDGNKTVTANFSYVLNTAINTTGSTIGEPVPFVATNTYTGNGFLTASGPPGTAIVTAGGNVFGMSGGLITINSGVKVVSNNNGTSWNGNLADMQLDGSLDLWDNVNEARMGALNGAGSIVFGTPWNDRMWMHVGLNNASGTFPGTVQAVHWNSGNGVQMRKSGTGTQTFNNLANQPFKNITINAGVVNLSTATNVTVSYPISGAGNLTKSGTGVLTLSGGLTYTGNTTVAEGGLTINQQSNFGNSSTVTIGLTASSPAVLHLPVAGTDIVEQLIIDGVPQAGNGAVYDASNSGGAITGVGKIQVGRSFSLNTSAPNGSIVLNPPGGSYPGGTTVTLTAVPDSGYRFNAWSDGASGNSVTTSITITGNTTVTASFIQQFTLTTSAANGTVTLSPPGGTYDIGTNVTMTAMPAAGYQLQSWSGDLTGAQNPTSVTMDANKSVTGNFSQILNATINTTGSTIGEPVPFVASNIYTGNGYLTASGPPGTVIGTTGGNVFGMSGGLITIHSGVKVITYNNGTSWNSNLADMQLDGSLDLWDNVNEARMGALNGAGSIVFGTPWNDRMWVHVGLNNASGTFSGTVQAVHWNSGNGIQMRKSGTGTQTFNNLANQPFKNITINAGVVNLSTATHVTVGYPISGAGNLTKSGTGVLTLSGVLTYTGNTTVAEGGLTINQQSNFGNSSTVTIGLTASSPAVLHLPSAGTDIVAQLIIDGVAQAGDGAVYDSSNSSGAITGVGKIQVGLPFTLTTSALNGSINLSPDGGSYQGDTLVNVTASPDAGFVFTGWSGDLSGSASPTSILMNGNKAITANFEPQSLPLHRSVWIADASLKPGSTPHTNAIDPSRSTRWSTGVNQANGQWFQVDLGSIRSFNRIVMDAGTWTGHSPASVEVVTSNDNTVWGAPIFSGNGSAITTMTFPTQTARYIRVNLTASRSGVPWSIADFSVYGPTLIPSPWVTADVGSVALVGTANFATPVWTLAGSGADIWNAADAFRYVYQSSTDDCSIDARVDNMTNTNSWAKAGVMIRESAAANSMHAMVCVTPGNGVSFQWRTATGGTCVNASVSGQTAPKWLRLTRSVNTFTAFRSDNGVNWTPVGSPQTITMASSATLGLALTSHNNGILCTSTFSSVSPTP